MPNSLFSLGTVAPNIDKGVNTTAVNSGGLATGSHALVVLNSTRSAIIVPAPVSSDAALTDEGVWPQVVQPGAAYRFTATASGPAHSLSWAANTITAKHTYNSVDADLATTDVPQRVYFQAFT